MEPEVHIIEKYFQIVLKCFTMTNIQLRGGKEIDLLAINPYTREKFHVESRISVSPSFRLTAKDTYTAKGKPKKQGLDYFVEQKFYHPTVIKGIDEIFGPTGDTNCRRVLVVWDVKDDSVVDEAKKKGIEIYIMPTLLSVLMGFHRARGSRDPILRLIELFVESPFLAKLEIKPKTKEEKRKWRDIKKRLKEIEKLEKRHAVL
jgi:hypothetical protein